MARQRYGGRRVARGAAAAPTPEASAEASSAARTPSTWRGVYEGWGWGCAGPAVRRQCTAATRRRRQSARHGGTIECWALAQAWQRRTHSRRAAPPPLPHPSPVENKRSTNVRFAPSPAATSPLGAGNKWSVENGCAATPAALRAGASGASGASTRVEDSAVSTTWVMGGGWVRKWY